MSGRKTFDDSTQSGKKMLKNSYPDPLLIVISGVSLGQIFPLKEKRIIIGRKEGLDIVIKDESISREHAEILFNKNLPSFIIKDKGSKNGVVINGVRVKTGNLKDGDRITLGETTLKFIYQDQLDITYYRRIAELINTDPLTGLKNRYMLESILHGEIERSYRYKEQFIIMMIDIDNFKSVNDKYGHLTGDNVLVNLAELFNTQLRSSDSVFRYGGEEFLILLPQTQKEKGFLIADRIRSLTETLKVDKLPGFTISIGVASFPEDAKTVEDLIDKADKALYKCKRTGKNKVLLFKED
ncbi:MAG: GGDEF domain-containing protein [Candidatus Coatesbacteria bacterium]|nr:GGDEF domain-containing protein [Candidatus Coatesbacteria bacterium]